MEGHVWSYANTRCEDNGESKEFESWMGDPQDYSINLSSIWTMDSGFLTCYLRVGIWTIWLKHIYHIYCDKGISTGTGEFHAYGMGWNGTIWPGSHSPEVKRKRFIRKCDFVQDWRQFCKYWLCSVQSWTTWNEAHCAPHRNKNQAQC